MSEPAVIFAKLAGFHKIVTGKLARKQSRYFDPAEVTEYFESYRRLAKELRAGLPALFDDLPDRPIPESSLTTDHEGRGYIERPHLEKLLRDLEYIFEVRSSSALAVPISATREEGVFISHGRARDWMEVQAFIGRDVGLRTLELAQEPNRGRTVLQKLEEESSRCSFAVVVMTGEDLTAEGERRTRENVMHEIGYFQGKYGLSRVCLLHQEGTNIPSNIHGLVYIPFPEGLVTASFGALGRELRDAFKTP